MIHPDTFTFEHIESIRKQDKSDPALIERAVFALGLLEAINRTGLSYIFKGGSSVMLLTDKPNRFSTDIDILVEPGLHIDSFINDASKIWPFVEKREDIRESSGAIQKRHFKFEYISPLRSKPQTIVLDVLFEENPYASIVERQIASSLLVCAGQPSIVKTPTPNCLIADKLTAFAPHTIGIPFGVDKELEIIKQLYDVASLLQFVDSFHEVKETFGKVASTEIAYRGLDKTPDECLQDAIDASACIIGRGLIIKEEYELFKKGIFQIRNHIFREKFTGEVAAQRACMVMYLAAAILTDAKHLPVLQSDSFYIDQRLQSERFTKLESIKKTDIRAYKFLWEATNMLSGS